MRHTSVTLSSILAVAAALLLAGTPNAANASDYTPSSAQKLGISTTFGRWNDGVVPIAYNPAGAPTVFSSLPYFESLMLEAFAEIEGAAGVTFDYQGTTAASVTTTTDDLVVIGWRDIGGAAGIAGPGIYSCPDFIADGYCHYTDGTVEFNNASVNWDTGIAEYTERGFKQVAVHELLHLLGIGHSEKQESIMYADPYTSLHHLRPDDIDALRSLYGWPLVETLAGIYIPPAAGTPLTSSYIAAFSDFNTPISTIDGTEDPDDFATLVWFVPHGTTASNVLVVTDPHGYFYRAPIDDRDCDNPGSSCGWVLTFARMDALFTFPGDWTVRVLINDEVVATESVEVTTSPTFNQAPDSYLVADVVRGQAPLSVNMTLNVTGDNESNTVDARWHIPTVGEIPLDSSNFPSGVGSDSRSVSFSTPGNDEVYVEVNDDWARYGSGGNAAGGGFRTLYRVEIEATDEADDITSFVDVTGDSVPDVAGFTGTWSGRPKVAVYSGANGNVDSTISYINDGWRGVALGTVRDADQNGTPDDPAVAVLTDNKTTQKIRVETRRVSDKAFLGSIQFLNENWRALDVVIVDDLNGDGNSNDSAIAVLAERISDGRIQLQLRDFDDGSLISNVIYLNARWSAVAAAVVDRSAIAPVGTLPPLIGVLAENPTNGKRIMQSRVASSGVFDQNVKFLGSTWNYHDISVNHDADGDGTNDDPIWQVLATRDFDRVMRVQSRRVSDGAFEANSVILNSTWRGLKFDASLDIDGNSDQEMVFSTLRRSTGARRIHIKDYGSNSTTLNISP